MRVCVCTYIYVFRGKENNVSACVYMSSKTSLKRSTNDSDYDTHTRTHTQHTHTQSEPSETNLKLTLFYYCWVCEAQKIDVCSVLTIGAGKKKISLRIFLFFRASRPQETRNYTRVDLSDVRLQDSNTRANSTLANSTLANMKHKYVMIFMYQLSHKYSDMDVSSNRAV